MSLNGSGVYIVNSTGQPVVANTLITAAVFNAFTSDIATALSSAIFKDGQQTITANLPMAGFKLTGLGAGASAGHSLRYEQLFTTSAVALLGALDQVKGADIASAATVNLTTATGNAVHITGAVAITAITLGSGLWRLVIFDGALTLTHHATNNNLPGAANITTAAGDRALYWSDGTTVYCINYIKAASIAATLAGSEELTNKTLTSSVGKGTWTASGTWTLPALTLAGVVSGGGQQLNNIIIGTSTPLAGTFTTLSANSISGTAVATQSDQETATSTTTVVSPGRQQFHPSAAKFWVYWGFSGTTIGASFNVSSITDVGTGTATVNITTAFSSNQWASFAFTKGDASAYIICLSAITTNAMTVKAYANVATGVTSDAESIASALGFGDQ